jgi:O-antigen/teichoic acid export membrane protein
MTTGRRKAALTTFFGTTTNTLIVSIQAVVLIPLYLKVIGPKLYGAWLGTGDILIWLQAIDLGSALMIQRIGIANGSNDKQKVGEYFTVGTIVLTLMAILVAIISFGLSFILPEMMGINGYEAKLLQNCFLAGALAAAVRMVSNAAYGLSLGIQETGLMNATKVISAISGLGVSLWLVLSGWGLWSIALGLVARSLVFFIGGVVFVATCIKKKTLMLSKVSKPVFREFVLISPMMALGNFGYALMNQSEAALAAIFIGPEIATILTITRKAIDVASAIVDAIASSSFGSFAHLLGSSEVYRILKVHAEIISLRFSVSVVLGAAYMAVNGSLVTLWVGSTQYGGVFLTILIALRFIFVGNTYLMNYLYRASGGILRGSLALLFESLIRIPLMIGLIFWLGILGLPIAGLITSGVFGLMAYNWTVSDLSKFSEPVKKTFFRTWIARILIFCTGIIMCLFVNWKTWAEVLLIGSTISLVGGVILLFIDPLLKSTRDTFLLYTRRLFNCLLRYFQN